MNLFYTTNIDEDFAYLQDEEARHCTQVLRKRAGDAISFVDGKGGFFEGTIIGVEKRQVAVKINSIRKDNNQRGFHLHLAIAPTKNMDRFEWLLEKCTELGIDEFSPLLCDHSERAKIRLDRLEKILLAAMKQSLRAQLPKLNEMVDLQAFINDPATKAMANRFIAHCQTKPLPHLKDNCQKGQGVIILIGPEGDFSEKEIRLAEAAGFKAVSLGKARLRTETAGMAACHIVNLINE